MEAHDPHDAGSNYNGEKEEDFRYFFGGHPLQKEIIR
jgi:hypothetical protein